MKRYFSFALASVVALSATVSSCSENSDDYLSEPPRFSAMTVKSLATGSETVRVGDPVVAALTENDRGKWLHASDYAWSCEPFDTEHRFRKGAIYDNDPTAPTDTLTFTRRGAYKIIFNGKYRVSAGVDNRNNYYTEIPGGRVTYSTGGILYYNVRVERIVNVVD